MHLIHTKRAPQYLPDCSDCLAVDQVSDLPKPLHMGCSVSVVVGRRTRDREVASSVPGRCIALVHWWFGLAVTRWS